MSEGNITNKELLLRLTDKVDDLSRHVEDELHKRPTRPEIFGWVGLAGTVLILIMI